MSRNHAQDAADALLRQTQAGFGMAQSAASQRRQDDETDRRAALEAIAWKQQQDDRRRSMQQEEAYRQLLMGRIGEFTAGPRPMPQPSDQFSLPGMGSIPVKGAPAAPLMQSEPMASDPYAGLPINALENEAGRLQTERESDLAFQLERQNLSRFFKSTFGWEGEGIATPEAAQMMRDMARTKGRPLTVSETTQIRKMFSSGGANVPFENSLAASMGLPAGAQANAINSATPTAQLGFMQNHFEAPIEMAKFEYERAKRERDLADRAVRASRQTSLDGEVDPAAQAQLDAAILAERQAARAYTQAFQSAQFGAEPAAPEADPIVAESTYDPSQDEGVLRGLVDRASAMLGPGATDEEIREIANKLWRGMSEEDIAASLLGG